MEWVPFSSRTRCAGKREGLSCTHSPIEETILNRVLAAGILTSQRYRLFLTQGNQIISTRFRKEGKSMSETTRSKSENRETTSLHGGFQGKVVFDISMSLDGLITGPDDSPEQPLGKGGERLHAWAFGGKTEGDALVFDEMVQTSGAIVAGRRMYDISPWGEKDPWGGQLPVFILTHAVPEGTVQAGAVYTFVTEGLESALNQAKAAAGEKNVQVIGGANIAQQYLKAGLIDEIQLHLVSVLLGEGIRLFDHLGSEPTELEITSVIQSKEVTHLRFRIVK